jgi:hypothetical protein
MDPNMLGYLASGLGLSVVSYPVSHQLRALWALLALIGAAVRAYRSYRRKRSRG